MLAGSSASVPASGRPRQAMLRRAVSTAYYAMFHALCQSNADTLVGPSPSGPDIELWLDTDRTLDHRAAKNRLTSYISLRQDLRRYEISPGLSVSMEEQRIFADYDPTARFVRSQVNDLHRPSRGSDARLSAAFQRRPADRLALYFLVRRRN